MPAHYAAILLRLRDIFKSALDAILCYLRLFLYLFDVLRCLSPLLIFLMPPALYFCLSMLYGYFHGCPFIELLGCAPMASSCARLLL